MEYIRTGPHVLRAPRLDVQVPREDAPQHRDADTTGMLEPGVNRATQRGKLTLPEEGAGRSVPLSNSQKVEKKITKDMVKLP